MPTAGTRRDRLAVGRTMMRVAFAAGSSSVLGRLVAVARDTVLVECPTRDMVGWGSFAVGLRLA